MSGIFSFSCLPRQAENYRRFFAVFFFAAFLFFAMVVAN
jgi:hypothetical protein